MKNTKIALVLAIFLLTVSTVTWGQATLGTPAGTNPGNQAADVVNGAYGHMSRGCYLCHTPHSLGVVQQVSVNKSGVQGITAWNGACIAASCPVGVSGTPGPNGAGVGIPVQGNVYLWGQALGQLNYSSWDTLGAVSFNAGAIPTTGSGWLSHPEVHTLMCLSCHDGSTTGSSYDLGYSYGTTTAPLNGPGGIMTSPGGTANGAFGPPHLNGVSWSPWNSGWSTGSLMNSHPIHAHYTSGGTTIPGLWNVSINHTAYTVYFTDNTGFNYWAPYTATGHPARLWTDGTDAYVECTTCHEPHRFSQYAYMSNGSWNPTDGGSWEVGPANSTVYYLRGPYSDATSATDGNAHAGNTTANGELNAQFCRSCHWEKSIEYVNKGGGASP